MNPASWLPVIHTQSTFSVSEVRKMIGTSSLPASRLICSAASKPSITGISASINTNCGRSRSKMRTASAPLEAVETRCP